MGLFTEAASDIQQAVIRHAQTDLADVPREVLAQPQQEGQGLFSQIVGDMASDIGAELGRLGVQGQAELAGALFNGNAYVPYGAGQAYRIDDTGTGAVFQIISFAPEVHRRALFAEQLEEARTGAADGLKAGSLFADVLRESRVYGVKAEEVEAIRDEQERGR